jgi:hypothetical protein
MISESAAVQHPGQREKGSSSKHAKDYEAVTNSTQKFEKKKGR